jgi:hypothetical protein
MVGTCSPFGAEEWCIQSFRGKVHNLEDPSIEGSIILKQIFQKCDGSIDFNNLVQNRDRWRALANAVIKL